MSMKERRRLAVLEQVESGSLTLGEASERLGLSVRQTRRIARRFKLEGDAGLVHRLRGRPGNRRSDAATRERAVSLYGERYADFGCTLAAEMLSERHGLVVDDQTLRRWLTEAGLWRRRHKSAVKRRRRPRKPRLGELVQIDGSHHDWFEGRGPHCVLMVMIDDATGWTLARFFEGETTAAAMMIFKQWSLRHGLPLELYPDQDSIYRVNTKAADEVESRTGRRPPTQFGRAMADLGVKLTCAKSPQAKGRVERMNGTLQDRLVKALRLEGIGDIGSANRYLSESFLPRLNARFVVEAVDPADAHLPTSEATLNAALCLVDERTVGRDHCVSWEGRVLQLKPGRGQASLAGKRVTVRKDLAGEVTVWWRQKSIEAEPVPRRPVGEAPTPTPTPTLVERVAQRTGPSKPEANHPWRRRAIPPRPAGGAGSAAVSASPRPPLRRPHPAA